MEANKISRITDAKYKSTFYSSIYKGKPQAANNSGQTRDGQGQGRLTKHEVDKHYYGTTYAVSFGKESYSQI